ncbi:hypothetical protein SNB92_05135, partial [Escherichia coli]|nr:hypothetical protein [Escherichia coli]
TSGEKRVFLVILFTSFSGSLVSRIPGAVHLGNTELPFAVKVWGSGDRQNVFEVGTTAAYLFYAQKTSSGQLFDVNGAINCTTLN